MGDGIKLATAFQLSKRFLQLISLHPNGSVVDPLTSIGRSTYQEAPKWGAFITNMICRQSMGNVFTGNVKIGVGYRATFCRYNQNGL